MSELLPCPFCGAPGVIEHCPEAYPNAMRVRCEKDCMLPQAGLDARKRAIEAWNKRVPFPLIYKLSPREQARVDKGLGFLPGYMLENDGSVKSGEWF